MLLIRKTALRQVLHRSVAISEMEGRYSEGVVRNGVFQSWMGSRANLAFRTVIFIPVPDFGAVSILMGVLLVSGVVWTMVVRSKRRSTTPSVGGWERPGRIRGFRREDPPLWRGPTSLMADRAARFACHGGGLQGALGKSATTRR
jgi:hypothetical protein